MIPVYFSIVIPVYNRVEILADRLGKILEQSFSDFEVVVIDDGSDMDIAALLRESFPGENKIRCIRQSNSERGAARNAGFKNAAGRYVAFFDSDDFMHKEHLSVLYKNIRRLNEPSFIATWFDFVSESGDHYPSDSMKLKREFYDYRLFLNGNPLACNICLRRDNSSLKLFEENRSFAIKEDWMFMIENLRNDIVHIVPEVTISMYDHAQRSMRSGNAEIIGRTHKAVQWIIDKINLSGDEQKILKAHENYFCSIHYYLDHNRTKAIQSAVAAIRYGGIKTKYLTILLKSLAGRTLISKLK